MTGPRDHILMLDFAGRFASRAETLVTHSAYRVLTPQSVAEAIATFGVCVSQIAFIMAAGESRDLASAMQRVEPGIRVFLLDGSAEAIAKNSDCRAERWLSSLRTFP
jgi:hypothetical protein